MAETGDSEAIESVKATIAGGTATTTTVTTLTTLLGRSASFSAAAPKSARTTNTKTVPTKTAKPLKSALKTTTKKNATVRVLEVEDEAVILQPKAQYALATAVVNSALKVLTDASRSSSKCGKVPTSPIQKRHAAGDATPPSQSRTLQSRSANATPVKRSSIKQGAVKNSPLSKTGNSASDWTSIAECARLAFSHLRSLDTGKVGVRALPQGQLEHGMLALCARLINLGLENLAIKELHAVKKRLEAASTREPTKKTSKTTEPERQTLASLLDVRIDLEKASVPLSLIISYQAHVLQLIANSQNPRTIEESVPYISLERAGSPRNVIKRQPESGSENAKVGKQLDLLFQTIMRMCPSVSAAADDAAKDSSRHVQPLTAFRLQTIALQIHVEALGYTNCSRGVEKEVVDPLSRCFSALLRRLPATFSLEAVMEACEAAYASFDLARENLESSDGLFTIFRTLSILAERACSHEKAWQYAASAIDLCPSNDLHHARYVAALTRKVAAMSTLPDHSCEQFGSILQSLGQALSGSAQDYEVLLGELSHLLERLGEVRDTSDEQSSIYNQFTRSVARFACRYARICPGKQTALVVGAVHLALQKSRTHDDLLSWINDDTARALIQAGSLRSVTERMAIEPPNSAWTCSSSAVALSRILKGLALKATIAEGKGIGSLCDDEGFDAEQRGAILEWQLGCMLEIAHKSKYREALSRLLPNLLRRLAKNYLPAEYPIRRARIASLAYRARATYPDLIPPHALQVFKGGATLHIDILANDEKLAAFIPDIEASRSVAEAFENKQPTLEDLRPSIWVWQRLIERTSTAAALEKVLGSPSATLLQLVMLQDYFAMLGDDATRLALSRMVCQLESALGSRGASMGTHLPSLTSAFLCLGYAERAEEALAPARDAVKDQSDTTLGDLEYHVVDAERLLSLDKINECEMALQDAAEAQSKLQPTRLRSHEGKAYRLLQARAWMLHSRYLWASSYPHEALQAAKRAATIVNGVWVSLETAEQLGSSKLAQSSTESQERPVDALTRGVSKLNLRPDFGSSKEHKACRPATKGAAFWSVVPVMCQALTHLADMYVHHGVFNEANYTSEKSVRIAEAVGSRELLSRMRYHRSTLLASAGKVEEAELCLAHEQAEVMKLSPLTKIQQLRAKAMLSVKHDDIEAAYRCLEKAEAIVKQIQSASYVDSLQRFDDGGAAPAEAPVRPTEKCKAAKHSAKSAPAEKRVGRLKPTTKASAAASSRKIVKVPATLTVKDNTAWGSCYILQKLEAHILLLKGALAIKIGLEESSSLVWLTELSKVFPDSFIRRHFEHVVRMDKANAALAADFSFNVLPESTLSFPVLQTSAHTSPPPLNTRKVVAKGGKVPRGAKQSVPVEESLHSLILAARQCLDLGNSTPVLSTAEHHKLYSMLSKTSIVLSAASSSEACKTLNPSHEALCAELPRTQAKTCSRVVAKLESNAQQSSDLLTWSQMETTPVRPITTAESFQSDYIEILPKPWTAVSLGLNEECDELYITRYQQGQTPLILRLPFSRQKPEDTDEEVFDFHVGRQELREIIDLSNYSCHSSMDVSVKGAKTNWWAERESLDRRLQELLINIENIWLGGFRGVLSLHGRDQDELNRFRKVLDATLDRHLPSRQSRGSKRLSLDDKILELFIGLGHDEDGEIDLDEALSDLLYFVVDMLQFNGERNAYDEIDFDNMAVDITDALRNYHEAVGPPNEDAHLILILDRRLQAFPWESLPCLESASVSRVDSMLTLRERIVSMRCSQPSHSRSEEQYHEISRHSGTYILNPSNDLKSTQTLLSPHLSNLKDSVGSPWSSIQNRAPSEEVFRAALSTSSTLLYFGHGAGSQYIRPRTIRKLEKCSEVVWLMGCSSGAVIEYDELEPSAVPLAYLDAGGEGEGDGKCLAVLATLWDVTDKDIDRFSISVGREWGLWEGEGESSSSSEPSSKTPRKRATKVGNPRTPEKSLKTPMKSPTGKTPVQTKTPSRSRSRARDGQGRKKQSLVQAVARSRDACYLKYLNGAASVVFGVPVWLGD